MLESILSISVPVWLIWVFLAVSLILLDLLVAGAQLFLVGAATGAVAAAIAATGGWTLETQTWIMLAGTILATPPILMLRPRGLARNKLREAGWANGQVADVVEWGGRQGVYLDGDFYRARYENGRQPDVGQRVRVKRMESTSVIVTDAPSQ